MILNEVIESESPFEIQISFNKLLIHYEKLASSKDAYLASWAQYILETLEPFPLLREGFSDVSLLKKHEKVIQLLLQDFFPGGLTQSEIKAATVPYESVVFNSSKRFQKIVEEAGPDFELRILDLPAEVHYIMACTVILQMHYGVALNYVRPVFYNIPDANGVMRYYRILYNMDFIEFLPARSAKNLSQKEIGELLEDFDNLELWKEKIPPNSFICKGFVISNIFDVTSDYAISKIKSNLIGDKRHLNDSLVGDMLGVFRSLFNLPDIRFGFSVYNSLDDQFEKDPHTKVKSFILGEKNVESCVDALCQASYTTLLKDNGYFIVPNVDKYYGLAPDNPLYRKLWNQGIKSAILAPISMHGDLFAILELVSDTTNELHGINAKILEDVMPYIVSAVMRNKIAEENLIDAIIQRECTTVHTSVYWKFREEAKTFRLEEINGRQASFGEIVFRDVFPLYGQTDIKESSVARNRAIRYDLLIQLSEINNILREIWVKSKLSIYEELMNKVNKYLGDINEVLHTTSEQIINDFVKNIINPVLVRIRKSNPELDSLVEAYEMKLNPDTGSYYDHRRNYEVSVMKINKNLVSIIDHKQEEAQAMYPHYFERYKTDGVEHNLYIGEAIAHGQEYSAMYRSNLRLWQLQVVCEMENAHYHLKPELPIPMDVTSLILAYSTSISIRFRMDEKRFDVDGTYNARYEVIKKRIDKSYIKGSNERLTQSGKLSIVYSQKKDELEYLRYIRFLKSKGYFGDKIEKLELEGLQGVTGLKAIRVGIRYKKDRDIRKTYTCGDLTEELIE